MTHFLFPVQVVEGVVDDETRITVIETNTGEKLTGENAPKKAELEEWLKQNPNYEVFEDIGNESGSEQVILKINNYNYSIICGFGLFRGKMMLKMRKIKTERKKGTLILMILSQS